MRNDLLEWVTGVIILLLIATAGYAQLAEDSIAGVWLFEEGKGKVAKDTSGNDNHAEFGSGAPKWVAGKYGQGIQLNGEDEWLTISTEKGKAAEELDFKESTSFSIHAWVFPDGDATGDAGQVKKLGAGFERALSVNRNGKLTVTWGVIKTERN